MLTFIEEGAGVTYPDKTAGAWDLLARAGKRGWAVGASQAKPGDLVVFNVGSGHVGMVEQIKAGKVTSIDGNAGDSVSRCARPLGVVRGFVAWPENLVAFKQSRAPFLHVVGSVTGTRKLAVAGITVPLPSKKVT